MIRKVKRVGMNANLYINAKDGYIFVLTPEGYEATPDHVKPERAVGQPVPLFSYAVPISWIERGWVREIEEERM